MIPYVVMILAFLSQGNKAKIAHFGTEELKAPFGLLYPIVIKRVRKYPVFPVVVILTLHDGVLQAPVSLAEPEKSDSD